MSARPPSPPRPAIGFSHAGIPARDGAAGAHSGAEQPNRETPFVTASHQVLFEDESATTCDACGTKLEGDSEDDTFRGSGLYAWKRGDTLRVEEPPLCGACATAIGVTAIARWTVEEEEG